jgi:hypothetical protein
VCLFIASLPLFRLLVCCVYWVSSIWSSRGALQFAEP